MFGARSLNSAIPAAATLAWAGLFRRRWRRKTARFQSFDDLVRPLEQRGWDREVEGPGGLHADHQGERGRLRDRQIGGAGAFFNEMVAVDGAVQHAGKG